MPCNPFKPVADGRAESFAGAGRSVSARIPAELFAQRRILCDALQSRYDFRFPFDIDQQAHSVFACDPGNRARIVGDDGQAGLRTL